MSTALDHIYILGTDVKLASQSQELVKSLTHNLAERFSFPTKLLVVDPGTGELYSVTVGLRLVSTQDQGVQAKVGRSEESKRILERLHVLGDQDETFVDNIPTMIHELSQDLGGRYKFPGRMIVIDATTGERHVVMASLRLTNIPIRTYPYCPACGVELGDGWNGFKCIDCYYELPIVPIHA